MAEADEASEKEIPPESLILSAAVSVWPRAQLLEFRRGVQVEVRAAPLADLAAYIGHLSQMDDITAEADMSVLWPLLVIPSAFVPVYDAQRRWMPGESTRRLFSAHDVGQIRAMPAKVIEGIFAAVVELSGMHKAEQKAAAWRFVNDGFFANLFSVAEKLGMTVSELCVRMPSYEFQWWMAFLQYRAMEEERAMHRPEDQSSASGFGGKA